MNVRSNRVRALVPSRTVARDLCRAVKRVRHALGDTQTQFAQRVGVVAMTISAFETTRHAPRDPGVLHSLARCAESAGFPAEAKLFTQQAEGRERRPRTILEQRVTELEAKVAALMKRLDP